MTRRERVVLYAALGAANVDLGLRFLDWKMPFFTAWCFVIATYAIAKLLRLAFTVPSDDPRYQRELAHIQKE